MRLRDEQSGNARIANPWIMRTAFVLVMMLLGYALGIYTTAHRSSVVVHALLDSPSLTGAYRFRIVPGEGELRKIGGLTGER